MRLFAAVLIACLMVVPISALASPQSALLAKMRAASGGPYVDQMVSVWSENEGNSVSIVTRTSQGIEFLSRRCLGVLCAGRYFNGVALYAIDSNDNLLPLSVGSLAGLRDLRSALALMFLAPDFQRKGGRIRLEPPYHQPGKDRLVLQMETPDHRSLSIWVDPKTALVTRIDSGLRSIRLRDYRRVGPYTVPFEESDSSASLRVFTSRRIISGDLRAPIGIAATANLILPGAERVQGSSLPIFACRLANVATHCIVDTGTSGMAISLRLAERLNALVIGAGTAHGLGSYATEVVRAGPLNLANAHFGPANYLVLPDLSGLGFDVILGNGLFASLTATLDARTLRFGTARPIDAQAISVRFPALLPELSVNIGNQNADFTLDTGDDAGFDLSAAFVKNHPTLFYGKELIAVTGVGGTAMTQLGDDRLLRLGSCTIPAFPTQLTSAMPSQSAGRIGARLLRFMTLYFNYPAGRIEFSPARSTQCTQPSR